MVTTLAVTVGVVIFGHQTDLLTSWTWTLVGLVFSMLMYFASTYTAFLGANVLAIYTMSLWALMAKRVVNFPPSRVIPLAMIMVFFYLLFSVWTVAYNFVPGGTLTRERTYVMLIAMVVSCGLATRSISSSSPEVKDQSAAGETAAVTTTTAAATANNGTMSSAKKVTFLGRVFRRLSTVTEEGDEELFLVGGGGGIVAFGGGDDNDGDGDDSAVREEAVSSSSSSETHQVLIKEVSMSEDKETQQFHTKTLKGEGMCQF